MHSDKKSIKKVSIGFIIQSIKLIYKDQIECSKNILLRYSNCNILTLVHKLGWEDRIKIYWEEGVAHNKRANTPLRAGKIR